MSRPRDLLIDYAHGALARAESVRLEEHLRSCPACRAEVRDVRDSFVELVESLPRVIPPQGVWPKIQKRIHRGRARRAGNLAWGLAVSLVLLFGAGLWGMRVVGDSLQTQAEAATVARWLSRDDVQRLPLGIYPSGGYGSVLLLPDGRALFVLSEPPERGNSYQAWGHANGTPTSLGVYYRPVFEVMNSGYDELGVSLEPRGGSPQPTHPLGSAELP